MRILVTGATGEVGRRFVPRLLNRAAAGDTVRVIVRDEQRGAPFAALGAEVVVGDLREPADVHKALAGTDAVVNIAAAFRGVPDDEMWSVNRDAALALGRAAVEAGTGRFVQVSTNLSYGVGRGRPLTEEDESVPGGFLWGVYPRSKAEAEAGLLALHRDHGLDVRVAVLPFVYGEGDSHLADAMRWVGTWPATRRLAMVHHADVAQGLLRLLFAPGIAGRRYNVSDDAPVTTVDLYRLNGVPLPGEPVGGTDPDPWYGLTSTRKIRDELGFRPLYPSVWTALDAGAL
ncbi:NAD(P)-dependent oxidoreductase [Streptomyces sp. NBC_00234]|uniref:NAD-dependent epimerase/dehydratase family protein n=1 Tax=Streptomyces sp. NBC_00234 TaxID=2903638 RepID=UPI002E299CC4|nr:NAD(P)-dependent oxidoreductase [Streptomyces sp. NBC_00234]